MTQDEEPTQFKNCKNCENYRGTMCLYSGHLVWITRTAPDWMTKSCGNQYEGWLQKMPKKGILKVIKEFFMGEK